MKALCLLLEVSRPGGVATSKPPLRLVLSDAAAVGLMGAHRGCQQCDELMALDCANKADNPHSPGMSFVFCFFRFPGDDQFIYSSLECHFLIVFILCCSGGVLCLGGIHQAHLLCTHTASDTL